MLANINDKQCTFAILLILVIALQYHSSLTEEELWGVKHKYVVPDLVTIYILIESFTINKKRK